MIGYYVAILLHEWGHGVVAWILEYKDSPFDVDYGGWLLLHVDEDVPYDSMMKAHQGVEAAFIAIAGLIVSLFLYMISWISLSRIKHGFALYSLFYWFSIWNMVAIFQYLAIQTFSVQGDVGRFTHGLNISPWWVFIPGTSFVFFALYRFYGHFVPKAYVRLSIQSQWVKRLFLLLSLVIMFLLIYSHGYNPLSDQGMPLIGKFLAGFSIALVPGIFFFCDPSRVWVQREIQKIQSLEISEHGLGLK